MLEVLKQRLKGVESSEEKLNKTREYLQILVLKILFEQEAFNNIAFVGGTALRILFDLHRFSEDLYFCLIEKKGYSFEKMLSGLDKELSSYGLSVEIDKNEDRVVNGAWIKFPELLYGLKIAQLRQQKLSIKLEIDTNPPQGWHTGITPITDNFVFAVKHFDLSSLYATKLHACFFRKYTKGRDFYDLVWYLGKKVEANYQLLNNAILQTESKNLNLSSSNIMEFLRTRISQTDFSVVRSDVERFLENKNEVKMLDKELIIQMLK